VVRVVNQLGYRYPSMSFLLFKDTDEAWATNHAYTAGDVVTYQGKKYLCAYSHTSNTSVTPATEGQADWLPFDGPTQNGTHRYDETIMVDEGVIFVLYPVDGDASSNRTVQITDVDEENKRFTLVVYDDAGRENLAAWDVITFGHCHCTGCNGIAKARFQASPFSSSPLPWRGLLAACHG